MMQTIQFAGMARSQDDAGDDTAWVERRSGLGLREFIAGHRTPHRPVILTDAAREWPACRELDPQWFREHHADKLVFAGGRDRMLGELLDLLERSSEQEPAPYPCKVSILGDFPELLPWISPRFACSLPDRHFNRLVPRRLFARAQNLEIFFGGPGGRFPYLHYDYLRVHAWITQIHGDKEFTVYAPGQEHLFYVNPDNPWISTIMHHHDPDYRIYPLFRQARSQKVVLRAGETLFMPSGWWHTARSLGMTISVAFDQLCHDNWPDFRREACSKLGDGPVRAALLRVYLAALGPVLDIAERFGADHGNRWMQR